jgi:hypothetical protein
MLSIMSLALQGRSEPLDRLARTGDSHATQIIVRDEVFSLYASRMFKRYQIDDQLQRKMIQRLSWLARRMQQQGTSVFWIERLEPIWLGTRVSKAVYAAMAATGAALLFTTMSVLAEMLSHVRDAMLMGVTFFSWFRFGSIAVPLTIAATTVEVARLLNAPSTRSGEDRTRSKVLSVAWLMLYLLLPSFLVIQGVGPYIGSRLVVGPGLAFWLAYGWQSAWRRSDTDIRLGDDLKWSWAHAIGGALFGAMFGFCAVITDMLLDFRVYEPSPLLAIPTAPFDRLVWTIAGWWHSDPSRFLKMAVAFGTLGAAAFGLKSTLRERTIQPNEGVRRTARRVLTFTLLTMVVLFATYQERSARIQRISVLWIYGTAIIGLLFGGVDILRHSSLRILLAAAGHFPFRAVRFLDCGVSLVFLRRVGGGYVFIHRMLLEYFANLPAAAGPARS